MTNPCICFHADLHYFARSAKGCRMATLTVTTRGQVTFKKEVLRHLGIQPGGKVRLDLLPDGRAELKADGPKGSWDDLRGMLKGKGNGARLSIEEINDATVKAGAKAGMAGLDES